MFSEDELGVARANGFGSHDLVNEGIGHHAALVDARLVSESVGSDDGLVGRAAKGDTLGEHLDEVQKSLIAELGDTQRAIRNYSYPSGLNSFFVVVLRCFSRENARVRNDRRERDRIDNGRSAYFSVGLLVQDAWGWMYPQSKNSIWIQLPPISSHLRNVVH